MDLPRTSDAPLHGREPLVSVISPTKNRREFIPRLLQAFLAQDYPHRELVIVEDGDDDVQDLIRQESVASFPDKGPTYMGRTYVLKQDHLMVRYLRFEGTLGAALNLGIQHARGQYCCRFDDDDWQAPDRISQQVQLAQLSGRPVVASSNGLFYVEGCSSLFEYTGDAWKCAGYSHFFEKDYALRNPYPDVSNGEDHAFIEAAYRNRDLCAVSGTDWTIVRAHPGNSHVHLFADPEYREAMVTSDNWRAVPFGFVKPSLADQLHAAVLA